MSKYNTYLRAEVIESQSTSGATYSTGVYNVSDAKYECGPQKYSILTTKETENITESRNPVYSCTFTAKQGNIYEIVIKNSVRAPTTKEYYDWGERAAWSRMERVNYIHIKLAD